MSCGRETPDRERLFNDGQGPCQVHELHSKARSHAPRNLQGHGGRTYACYNSAWHGLKSIRQVSYGSSFNTGGMSITALAFDSFLSATISLGSSHSLLPSYRCQGFHRLRQGHAALDRRRAVPLLRPSRRRLARLTVRPQRRRQRQRWRLQV